MQKYILLFFCLLYMAYATDLPVVLGQTISHNEKVQAARAIVHARQEDVLALERTQYPLVNADYAYSYVSEVPELELATAPGQPTKKIKTGVNNTNDYGLGLQWHAFDGFARESRIEQARQVYALAQCDLERAKRDVAYQAASLYIAVATLQLQAAELAAAQLRMKEQRNAMQQRVVAGQALPIDVVSLDLAVNQYAQAELTARSQAESITQQLNDVAGVAVTINSRAPDLVSVNVMGGPFLDLDLQRLRLRQELVLQLQCQSQASGRPDVSLSASSRRGRPGVNPINDEWMNYWRAGALVQWNIWDWGSRAAKQSSAEYEYAALVAEENAVLKKQATVLQAIQRDYTTAAASARLTQAEVQLAKQKQLLLRRQAENGQATQTDCVTAEQVTTEAFLKYQRAVCAARLKVLEYDYYSGRPLADWRLSW